MKALKTFAVCTVVLAFAANSVAAAEKPNIVVFLTDDQGYGDVGCYGSKIQTPNIDKLCRQGMKFTDFYVHQRCSPTRLAFMTGSHPQRVGCSKVIYRRDRIGINSDEITTPELLQKAGYATGIVGKWHLGEWQQFNPTRHGFDSFYGFMDDGEGFAIYRDKELVERVKSKTDGAHTDKLLAAGIDFIKANKDKPFLVYYPMALVHSPFIEPPRLEKLARSKYVSGLDRNTETIGHMITYMDDIVGQIMASLKKHYIDQKTLILFTGENGTDKKITSKLAGLDIKGGKGSMTEAGTRVPLLAWWPGTIKPGVRDELFCLVDVLPTIASVAGIKVNRKLDGMDLSHNLLGGKGQDRDQVLMSFKKKFFVRDKCFRLDQDGVLYYVPVTSDKDRDSEKRAASADHATDREGLQKILDKFMAIKSEFKVKGKSKGKSSKK